MVVLRGPRPPRAREEEEQPAFRNEAITIEGPCAPTLAQGGALVEIPQQRK